MTVRELIARLINCDMDANVMVITQHEKNEEVVHLSDGRIKEYSEEIHLG